MEAWYMNLIAEHAQAANCFAHDYIPFSSLLGELKGAVLDVGGGIGLVRHFLPDGARYIVVDPSIIWTDDAWASIASDFPCVQVRPRLVRGIGEHLPFPPGSFDAVLSFWSLNHVSDPERTLREAYRVLRPMGRCLLVLEDMEPRWGDLVRRAFIARGVSRFLGVLAQKLRCTVFGKKWPLADDHLRIRESDIRVWTAGRFRIAWRAWIGSYLTYELQK